jgi:hypothetical protein
VVAPTAAALRLSPRGRTFTGEVRARKRDAPGCVAAVALRMAEVLAALALQWALRCHVRFHSDPQTTEPGDGSHPGHLWPSRHQDDKVRGGGTVLVRILVAAARSELHESLYTYV